MRVLVDELKSSTPRPKSPHMNNEEPISFSHYPDGQPPPEVTNGDEVDNVSLEMMPKIFLSKQRSLELSHEDREVTAQREAIDFCTFTSSAAVEKH